MLTISFVRPLVRPFMPHRAAHHHKRENSTDGRDTPSHPPNHKGHSADHKGKVLVISAKFDRRTQDYLQEKRDQYFPKERNVVPAHISLFHKLPGEELSSIRNELKKQTRRAHPLQAHIAEVKRFGHGGAFEVRCGGLDKIHAALREAFHPWLTAQDAQPYRSHVTYQNKVSKAEAEEAYQELNKEFNPFRGAVVALELWWYHGHWEPAGSFRLRHSHHSRQTKRHHENESEKK